MKTHTRSTPRRQTPGRLSCGRAGVSIRSAARKRARGFTLLEVMVALVITSIGLLGIAKIQALAYASTASAGLRSLVALEASSLAATMHANRNYWAAGQAPVPLTISGPTVQDATLGPPANCVAVDCSNDVTLAAYDLQTYATALYKLLGSNAAAPPITTINCPVTIPVTCTIQVTWSEHQVSINSQSAAATQQSGNTAATAGTFAPTYTLYVEP